MIFVVLSLLVVLVLVWLHMRRPGGGRGASSASTSWWSVDYFDGIGDIGDCLADD